MNVIKQVTDTLTAMGTKPITNTDSNGNTVIKVNAPTVPQEAKK